MQVQYQEVKGEVECKVAARRLWKAAFQDGHVCMPKAMPHTFSHVSYEGGLASQPTFSTGATRTMHLQPSYAEYLSKQQHPGRVVYHVKDKLEEVDNDNFKMKGRFVEGGFLDVLAKSYTQYVHIKQGAAPNTCKVEWCIKFQPLSEQLKPQAIKAFQEYVPLGYKALEAYLLSHNDYK